VYVYRCLFVFEGVMASSSVSSSTNRSSGTLLHRGRKKKVVFLSYRFADADYAQGLIDLLNQQGFEVWTGRNAADSIAKEVLKRISESDFFVSLITRDALKADGTYTSSPWLLEEKGAALALGKPLVLMIEDGVTDFGGLQGDWQRIHFGAKTFLTAALQALSQLNTYARRR
jgi:hypothetical protein